MTRNKMGRVYVLISSIALLLFAFGCATHYQQEFDRSKTKLNETEWPKSIAVKYEVPLRLVVHASNDTISKSGSNYFHYPLRQLVEQCFTSVIYNAFAFPSSFETNAFELRIEPQQSSLTTSGSNITYKLSTYVSFYEPGGKLITSFVLEKGNESPAGDLNQVPDAVYQTIKDLAIESLKRISVSPDARKSISRFSDK